MSQPERQALAIASCTKSAIAIATRTLALASDFHEVDIVAHVPVVPFSVEYRDFGSLTEAAFYATQGLLAALPEATVGLSVLNELVSERVKNRRRTFSVGLIVACYREAPLFLFQAEDWISQERVSSFNSAAQAVISRMQERVNTPPTPETLGLARLLGNTLMNLITLKQQEQEDYIN